MSLDFALRQETLSVPSDLSLSHFHKVRTVTLRMLGFKTVNRLQAIRQVAQREELGDEWKDKLDAQADREAEREKDKKPTDKRKLSEEEDEIKKLRESVLFVSESMPWPDALAVGILNINDEVLSEGECESLIDALDHGSAKWLMEQLVIISGLVPESTAARGEDSPSSTDG